MFLKSILANGKVLYRLVSNEETLHKYPFPFCLEKILGYPCPRGKKIEVCGK